MADKTSVGKNTLDKSKIQLSLSNKLFNKNFFYIVLLVMVFFDFTFVNHNIFSPYLDWQDCELVASYRFGFIKRGFLGSVLLVLKQVFNLDYYTSIVILHLVGEVIYTCSVLIFLIHIIKKCNENRVNLIVVLFMCFHLTGYYYYDWGELDIFLIPITLLILLIALKDKYLWMIPALTLLGIMIHEGYVMMYLGVVISCLLYKCLSFESIR